MLKGEDRNKQVTADNLIDVIRNFTVIENKYTRNKRQETNVVCLLMFNVINKDRIEQNRDELELTKNVKVNINDQINEHSKSNITTKRDRSDNDKNTPPDIYNNIIIFGDSIPQGINSWNLDTRLCTAKCKCHFFGGARSKHFHYYIQPTLNEKKPENTYCCSAYGDK